MLAFVWCVMKERNARIFKDWLIETPFLWYNILNLITLVAISMPMLVCYRSSEGFESFSVLCLENLLQIFR